MNLPGSFPLSHLGKLPFFPQDCSSLQTTENQEGTQRPPLLWRGTLLWQQLRPPSHPLRGALTQAEVSMATSRVEGP